MTSFADWLIVTDSDFQNGGPLAHAASQPHHAGKTYLVQDDSYTCYHSVSVGHFPLKGHKLWACFPEGQQDPSSRLAVSPRSSPPTDAKTLRDGDVAPTKMSLLSLTIGRLLPSIKPEVFEDGSRVTVNPNDAE